MTCDDFEMWSKIVIAQIFSYSSETMSGCEYVNISVVIPI